MAPRTAESTTRPTLKQRASPVLSDLEIGWRRAWPSVGGVENLICLLDTRVHDLAAAVALVSVKEGCGVCDDEMM